MKIVDKGLLNQIQINKAGHKSENSSITILGSNNKILIESRCSFTNFRLVVRGHGNNIVIKRGAWFLGGAISVTHNCTVAIGERSSFGQRLEIIVDNSSLIIGDDCMVAAGLNIRTSDTHGIYNLEDGQIINKPKNIEIGDYVWLGRDVTVLKGAKIAPCNIIATQSIFTKESQAFECWGGSPAKKLRENVMWSKSGNLEHIADDKYAKLYMEKYGKLAEDDPRFSEKMDESESEVTNSED